MNKKEQLEEAVRDALSFVENEWNNHPRTNDYRYDRLKYLKMRLEQALKARDDEQKN